MAGCTILGFLHRASAQNKTLISNTDFETASNVIILVRSCNKFDMRHGYFCVFLFDGGQFHSLSDMDMRHNRFSNSTLALKAALDSR